MAAKVLQRRAEVVELLAVDDQEAVVEHAGRLDRQRGILPYTSEPVTICDQFLRLILGKSKHEF